MSNTEKENPDSIKSEKCILCGKNTGIPFNEPIDKRKYYIRGSGQLCDNCYYALYPYVLDKYETNIPKVGRFFMFLKTTPGYIVCILIPFLLLILLQRINCIGLFRRYKLEQMAEMKEERAKIEEERAESQKMMAELLALKAQLAGQQTDTAVNESDQTGDGAGNQ